jgi:hypothetical protein
VTGERTTVPVRIGPEDRREGLAVLPIGQKPKPVKFRTSPARMDLHSYYPPQALNREVEADIVVGCVVQADLSVICPEVTTTTTAEDLKSAFAAAASKIVTLYRVEPLLADGKSAVGASFRSRIKFRIG